VRISFGVRQCSLEYRGVIGSVVRASVKPHTLLTATVDGLLRKTMVNLQKNRN